MCKNFNSYFDISRYAYFYNLHGSMHQVFDVYLRIINVNCVNIVWYFVVFVNW